MLIALVWTVLGAVIGAVVTAVSGARVLRDIESAAQQQASFAASATALQDVGILWKMRAGQTNEAIEELEVRLKRGSWTQDVAASAAARCYWQYWGPHRAGTEIGDSGTEHSQ